MPQRRNSDATGLDSLVPGEVQSWDAGDSWTVIGAALDTTRQAAFQRFGKTAKGGESPGTPPRR